jgi:transcriptional regulator with XRE-family HTH domain
MPLSGDRLKAVRIKRRLSQRELAKHCGLGEKAIFRYENNQGDPSAENLARIARELNVSADYLLELSSDERGQLGGGDLTENEIAIIEAYRKGGWVAANRFIADKLIE